MLILQNYEVLMSFDQIKEGCIVNKPDLVNVKEYKVLYTYIKVKTGVNYLAFASVSTSTRQQLQLLLASAGGVGLLAKAWPLKPPKTPLPLRRAHSNHSNCVSLTLTDTKKQTPGIQYTKLNALLVHFHSKWHNHDHGS